MKPGSTEDRAFCYRVSARGLAIPALGERAVATVTEKSDTATLILALACAEANLSAGILTARGAEARITEELARRLKLEPAGETKEAA